MLNDVTLKKGSSMLSCEGKILYNGHIVHCTPVHSQQFCPNNTLTKVKGKLLWRMVHTIFYLDNTCNICVLYQIWGSCIVYDALIFSLHISLSIMPLYQDFPHFCSETVSTTQINQYGFYLFVLR